MASTDFPTREGIGHPHPPIGKAGIFPKTRHEKCTLYRNASKYHTPTN